MLKGKLLQIDKKFDNFQKSSIGTFLIEKIFFRTKGFYSVISSLTVFLIIQLSALSYAKELSLAIQEYINTSEYPVKLFWYIADFFAPTGNWLIIIILILIIPSLFWIRNKELKIPNRLEDMLSELKALEELNLSDEWFKNQNELAIKDLGPRYTPEVNVELEIVENFDAISRNKRFKKKCDATYHVYMLSYRKFLEHIYVKNEGLESHIEKFSSKLEILENKYDSILFDGIEYIYFEELKQFLEEVEPIAYEIRDLLEELNRKEIEEKKITTSHGYRTATQYDSTIRNLRDHLSNQYQFKELLNSRALKITNNPFMILDGEAGIGKSHLLADIVSQRIKDEENSIFLLGQHFREDKAPWSQILYELLELNCSKDEFLSALNTKAETQRKRIIIFIDAINEGKGRTFWNEFLVSFIESVKQYEWLGLVVSIRSSYYELIIPKEVSENSLAIPITHFGFDGMEYNASKIFFENYSILQPSIPMLHPEFSNPLFLKLFCEGLHKKGLTKIPDGYEGITNIIKFFIEGIEEKLLKKYPNIKTLKLIEKTISALLPEILTVQTIAYDRAVEIFISEVSSKYGTSSEFLDDLISEGLLTMNVFYDYKEKVHIDGLYFAYERFEDHIKVKYIFEHYLDIENPKQSFQEDELSFYFEEHNLYSYRGMIDAMAIQLPEICNVELIDMVSQNEIIIDSFFNGLLWRKAESITSDVVKRILKNISNDSFQKEIFEVCFSLSSNPKHPLNANLLHEYMSKFSMKDRDVFFISLLNHIYLDTEVNPIKRLIDWAWSEEEKDYISDDSILLTSIALSWLLTTSNRHLRDYATKALASVLKNRPHIVLNLLMKFENINDPYVYERLFAVGFGVVVHSSNKKGLKELGEYVYKTIFEKDEVYPHILLRDYAKNIIEYIYYLGIDLDIDLTKIKPPYKSKFPKIEELPTNEEINKYEDKDLGYHQSRIISSMMTEYGGGMYGDFGRYVFGSALHSFECKKEEQLISNYATKKIFEEYGYESNLFNQAEKSIQEYNRNSYDRHNHNIERIGKKYQWIAMYETLARLTDNFKMYEGYGDDKKEVIYQGSFEPYVRDIDPTNLMRKNVINTNSLQEDWCEPKQKIDWAIDNDNWVQTSDDLPNPFELISHVDSTGEEWISLHSFPVWKEPIKKGYDRSNVIRKEVWYILNAYLIPTNELNEFTLWAKNQRFWNNWMPEGKGHYQMFNREQYWSDAYKFLQDPYYGYEDWSYIDSHQGTKYPHKVGLTYNSYYWEEEFDYSKEETLGFLKPSKILFDGLQLQYSSKEGEFINDEGKVICFDTKMKYSSFDSLLFNKKLLFQYLKDNNLSLCWTIIGEKQIFVPMNTREEKVGLMQMNGYCFMKENMDKGGEMNIMSMDKNGKKNDRNITL